MTLKFFMLPVVLLGLFDGPGGHLHNSSPGAAIQTNPIGHQVFECSGTRTALPQTKYQITLRIENRAKIAGVPLAFPELTVAYIQAVTVPKHNFRLPDEERCVT